MNKIKEKMMKVVTNQYLLGGIIAVGTLSASANSMWILNEPKRPEILK